jgi:hypothetical protein
MLALSWLAACAPSKSPTPAASPVPQAVQSPEPSSKCGIAVLGHSVRPGEDLQFVFTVKANSQWCFDGIALGGNSTEGQAVTESPSHGALRLVPRPGAIIFGYRPNAGYSGSDRFRIGVPAELETIYLAGHVTVEP